VIQVELGASLAVAAILTRIAIARVDIRPAEANVTARHAVEVRELYHPRHANRPADGADRLVRVSHGEHAPGLEVEGVVVLVYRSGDALVQEDECATRGRDVDR
jgi:hypothetical protein